MRDPRSPISVALALAVAVLAGCGDEATSSTASGPTPEPTPATAIPDDFPLTSGMGGPEDDLPTSRTGTGLRDLAFCGTSPLRGLGIRDRMVADNSGGESADTRELVLLGSPEEPQVVARAFADAARDCDEPVGDMTTSTEVRGSPHGASPAATLLQAYVFDGTPGAGTTVIQLIPVGSALLVSSTYGEWPDADLEDGVAETQDALSDAVAAMEIFTAP